MLEETTMEESFDRAGPDLDEEKLEKNKGMFQWQQWVPRASHHKMKALIRWILQYDPAKRPSPAEILSDPWFCKIDVESDSSKVDIV
jgi:serine/threonine protein kinase